MAGSTPTLGTLLRQLVDHLDGAVEAAYVAAGLDYRPRYTPVIRALLAGGPRSIRALSIDCGVTHSALSQTISEMARRGLVTTTQSELDARERVAALTSMTDELVPRLERHWAATEAAARSLDRDIGQPLSDVLVAALAALERTPFAARLEQAMPSRGRREPR